MFPGPRGKIDLAVDSSPWSPVPGGPKRTSLTYFAQCVQQLGKGGGGALPVVRSWGECFGGADWPDTLGTPSFMNRHKCLLGSMWECGGGRGKWVRVRER